MVIQTITVSNCQPQTIVIGRRGTYDTLQIAFDLSYLVENYGDGTAVLAVKRSQDTSAYPAVASQANNILTWMISDVDTYYVGSGECQLMWYVEGGLAKTIIYPMVVMRDILATSEEAPDAYQTWVDDLTALGAETLQNAQNAAQSASDAESAKGDAIAAKEAAEEAAEKAEEASVHSPIIHGGYWYIWNNGQYVDTGVRAEGQKGDKGDPGEKGDTGNGIASITKTGTSGLVDTYTVTYTDGTTTTFTVTNGAKGDKGDTGATGNGIQSITKTGTSGNVDTYTITYTNGQTTTFTVTNGAVSSVAGKTGAVTLNANDVAFSESGTYDDGTVGKELSNQKNAIGELNRQLNDETTGLDSKAPVILETVSGAIASFDDGADSMPIKKLVAQIEPVQDLHGYENPWPAGGGKNKVNYSVAFPIVSNGITISQNDDGSISINGTATANINQILMAEVAIDNGAWTISGVPTNSAGGNLSIWARNTTGGTEYERTYNGLPGTLNISTGSVYIYCTISSGTTVDNVKVYLQLEAGSTATDWTPYENICPISGWTGAEIEQAGKNLANTDVWYSGIDYNPNVGAVIAPAVATDVINYGDGTFGFPNLAWRNRSVRTEVKAGLQYYINGRLTAQNYGAVGWVITDSDYKVLAKTAYYGTDGFYEHAITAPAGAKWLWLFFCDRASGTVTENIIKEPMVSLGSTATDFAPYAGTTIPITWETEAGTVYGGTLDVVSGKLMVDYVKKTVTAFDGVFGDAPSGYCVYAIFSDTHNLGVDTAFAKSNIFTYFSGGRQEAPLFSYGGSNGGATTQAFILPSTVTSLAEANAWLANNPTECTFKLATPIEYTLTPNELTTLYGQNNVWTDVGEVSVDYPADTKLYIDNKIATAVANALNA